MQAETIAIVNGDIEATEEIGTLSGTIYDQFGNESNKMVIEEVSYLPNGTFNLFSLIMGGNNKSIWIEKVRNKIVFDWMIPMTKGMLFAMNFTRDTKNNQGEGVTV
jgi:hypothetical protein